MQLLFSSRDDAARELREWALARARFVFRRLSGRVSRATLQLTDIDGVRHGVDKRCRVEVVSSDGRSVVVTALARNWPSGLNRALVRAVETLQRQSSRGHAQRRSQRRVIRAGLSSEAHSPVAEA